MDIKSDGGYHLITIVWFCITWSVLSNENLKEIIRWVITADSHRANQYPRSKKLNKILSCSTNVSSFLHNLQRQSRFDVLEQLYLCYTMGTNEFVLKYCKYVSCKWRWHRQPSCSSWLKTQGKWEGSHMNINTCLFCYSIDKIDMCWYCYLWQPL